MSAERSTFAPLAIMFAAGVVAGVVGAVMVGGKTHVVEVGVTENVTFETVRGVDYACFPAALGARTADGALYLLSEDVDARGAVDGGPWLVSWELVYESGCQARYRLVSHMEPHEEAQQ